MPRFLEKRRRRWYAILEVPKDLQRHYGKRRFLKSLETESQTEAERLVLSVVAGWKAEFEAVRSGSSDALDALALEWRKDYAQRNKYEEEIYQGLLADKYEEIASESKETADTFQLVVEGTSLPLQEHLEEWLGTLRNDSKTIDMKRSDILRFAKNFPYSHQVRKRDVERWAYKLTTEHGLKTGTVSRILSACRGYWGFLDRSGYIDREDRPFAISFAGKGSQGKEETNSKRKHFEPDEICRLLEAAEEKQDQSLSDLIRIAMWTGCRIEEICSLKVEDVSDDSLTITDAKSSAGHRTIPIHSQLRSCVQELKSKSSDGYLLSGLTFNKYGDRSNAVGKRFGTLKRGLGFGTDRVFHSIRKTVATQLENAGVPEGVAADILGHEKQTMTYGLYSGGTTLQRKMEAIEELSYPDISSDSEISPNKK
ncbi:tyrosine-type recombinase/integrase [Yoonia algicola]|uniref:Tyrosine-type recombinase/integrase n=1 Tax=Yoonia algicola TaxID=3137368 RepID=A0AAN0M5P5_9RHOB